MTHPWRGVRGGVVLLGSELLREGVRHGRVFEMHHTHRHVSFLPVQQQAFSQIREISVQPDKRNRTGAPRGNPGAISSECKLIAQNQAMCRQRQPGIVDLLQVGEHLLLLLCQESVALCCEQGG